MPDVLEQTYDLVPVDELAPHTAELARLQSFPDAYDWDLDNSPHALVRFRIGNSVPPLMMREIAGTIRTRILDRTRERQAA